jgi:hypothetical protein
MSAQQEKKAEMEKENLITYFDSRLLVNGFLRWNLLTGSHIDSVRIAHMEMSAYCRASAVIRYKSLVRVILRAPLPCHTGSMLAVRLRNSMFRMASRGIGS